MFQNRCRVSDRFVLAFKNCRVPQAHQSGRATKNIEKKRLNVGSLASHPSATTHLQLWKVNKSFIISRTFEYYYICDFLVNLISNVSRIFEAFVTRCLTGNIIHLICHVTRTLLFSPQSLVCSCLDLVDLCLLLRKAPGPMRVLHPTVHDVGSWSYGCLIAIKIVSCLFSVLTNVEQ